MPQLTLPCILTKLNLAFRLNLSHIKINDKNKNINIRTLAVKLNFNFKLIAHTYHDYVDAVMTTRHLINLMRYKKKLNINTEVLVNLNITFDYIIDSRPEEYAIYNHTHGFSHPTSLEPYVCQ